MTNKTNHTDNFNMFLILVPLVLSIAAIIIYFMIMAGSSLELFLLYGTVLGRDGETVSLLKEIDGQRIVCTSVRIKNKTFRLSCTLDTPVWAI